MIFLRWFHTTIYIQWFFATFCYTMISLQRYLYNDIYTTVLYNGFIQWYLYNGFIQRFYTTILYNDILFPVNDLSALTEIRRVDKTTQKSLLDRSLDKNRWQEGTSCQRVFTLSTIFSLLAMIPPLWDVTEQRQQQHQYNSSRSKKKNSTTIVIAKKYNNNNNSNNSNGKHNLPLTHSLTHANSQLKFSEFFKTKNWPIRAIRVFFLNGDRVRHGWVQTLTNCIHWRSSSFEYQTI